MDKYRKDVGLDLGEGMPDTSIEQEQQKQKEAQAERTESSTLEMWNNRLKLILLILVGIMCVFTVGAVSSLVGSFHELANHKKDRGNTENIIKMLQEIDAIYDEYYIGEDITAEELEDGILAGVGYSYNDPYGLYRSPEETEDYNSTQNELIIGGIGIQSIFELDMKYFEPYRYCFYIKHIYENTPAERAGLRIGDRIVEADGTTINNNNRNEVVNIIKGKVGEPLELKLIRTNEETGERTLETMTIVRENIDSASIITDVYDNIGYIKIDTFSNKTDEEFEEAVTELKQQGISKFILDVRDNGGGSADTVIRMLDLMLPEGLIVDLRYKDGSMKFNSDANEMQGDFVVLVNEYSASASELFAKALQEYDKATIIGVPTYGKGTIISTVPLTNGGSITLSVGKYYTKSGDNLENVGVIPDEIVEIPKYDAMYLYKLPKENDLQLMKALEILNNKG